MVQGTPYRPPDPDIMLLRIVQNGQVFLEPSVFVPESPNALRESRIQNPQGWAALTSQCVSRGRELPPYPQETLRPKGSMVCIQDIYAKPKTDILI